jgi:hypothetical protein
MPKRKKPRKPSKTKVGAPSLYRPEEHPKAARLLAANGKGIAEMAEAFGVERHTVGEWRAKHPEFAAAIALGMEDATDRVERALLERAIGYSHPAVKILTVSGGQGMGSSVEQIPYTEHYPPDPEAAKYWLKNRRPATWRDKQEVEHTGKLTLEQLVDASLIPPSEKP